MMDLFKKNYFTNRQLEQSTCVSEACNKESKMDWCQGITDAESSNMFHALPYSKEFFKRIICKTK